ncbi:MAG: response regulator [Candidatus Omnitrophica bacterium]|nr:response regulator [Candidatus Omnitrophota bacterium]
MEKKILVIDDEEILTRTLSRLLGKKGYQVTALTKPEEALSLIEKTDFDLVLCDIRMPGMNGVETVREMKRIGQAAGKNDFPVIFLTGYADIKLENEAKALQPVAFVFKPFDAFYLLEIIQTQFT